VRAIDALLTCGRGQRIGVFGGSGVGKSTLLGMMARGTEADVVVLALIGERGREVRSFIEHDLGPRGLERSVVVVSTSDSPPLARQRAAYAATAIAERFRDDGKHVLLMMDSITRFAMAQREVGLAAGEPPTAKGYPPSVFARLPGLLERAGALRDRGSITAFYTVLVEGDDTNEPISDSVRAILDGHIILSRDLAARNHYPAIDILPSVSRTMPAVTSPEHRLQAAGVREWMATLRDNEDLVSVGAYAAGSNPRIDAALARRDAIGRFLCQPADTSVRLTDAIRSLGALSA
jgi:FliI/YscN family ATPase